MGKAKPEPKKAATKTGKAKRNQRMTRIPEPLAVAMEAVAAEQYSDLASELRVAVREYLEKRNRMPDPPKA